MLFLRLSELSMTRSALWNLLHLLWANVKGESERERLRSRSRSRSRLRDERRSCFSREAEALEEDGERRSSSLLRDIKRSRFSRKVKVGDGDLRVRSRLCLLVRPRSSDSFCLKEEEVNRVVLIHYIS